ncbi:MAG TPA: sialate O-acetylesterase, partial [Chitinophagaceae bacterium]|nr:sialate O-acetylesterase [Chitinophagaceae bacterium]
SVAGLPALLSLGPIDDIDETYVNGKLVGKTGKFSVPRIYNIERGLLTKGKNSIIIRVYDTGGGGGFMGKPAELFIDAGASIIPLSGEWWYKLAVTTSQFGVKATGPNAFPSQLYNAMIAPVIKFPIKGVIWYQGEANTNEAFRYRSLFPALINDWRTKWGYAFPFHWVQLANYLQPDTIPSGSRWAELREAQHQTLSLPNTGEAIAIDIGEANDIHPKNKQDVGLRLAMGVLKDVYEKKIPASGPVFTSMQIEKGKIILTFSNAEGGLVAKANKYGYLKGFTIAGSNQEFVWAKAYITSDNKVIVFNESIPEPVAVRYGWADNPDDVNLYNKEGLPASPFRTDQWKGITADQ